jgi:hypothetical protein
LCISLDFVEGNVIYRTLRLDFDGATMKGGWSPGRIGATLQDCSLRVEKIVRVDCGDVAGGQPLTWTFLEFQMDVEDVELRTQKLNAALDDAGGDLRRLRRQGV